MAEQEKDPETLGYRLAAASKVVGDQIGQTVGRVRSNETLTGSVERGKQFAEAAGQGAKRHLLSGLGAVKQMVGDASTKIRGKREGDGEHE